MAAAGVDAALIHPPGWDPNSGAIAEAAAQNIPIVCDPWQFPAGQAGKPRPDRRLEGRPGMLGLRLAFTQPHQQTWTTDGTMDWVWPAAEKAGMPVALMAASYLPQVAQIAERHPGLKLIIDHLRPGRAAARTTRPRTSGLLALAKFPTSRSRRPARRLFEPALSVHNIHDPAALFDAFGPERFFWGTDITRMPCPGSASPSSPRSCRGSRAGPRAGHGPRALRLARLEAEGP